jgi:hypothetical protein
MTDAQESYLSQFLAAYEKRVSKPVLDEVGDHYHAAIVTAMTNGSSFDKALTDTHEAFGRADGILALEAPFQKSLVIRHRDGVEQTLGTFLRGKKLLIALGLFLYTFWKNSTDSSSFFLADVAILGVLLLAIHCLSYHTEQTIVRANWNWLLTAACLGTETVYLLNKGRIITYLQATGSWVPMAGWSAFQTLLLLVLWANFTQKRSPYLKRTDTLLTS